MGFFLLVFGPSSGFVPFVYFQCTFGQLCCFCDQCRFLYPSKKKKKKNSTLLRESSYFVEVDFYII